MPPLTLTPKEVKLIEHIRALGYGSLRVIVVDKQPDRAEEEIKTTKF